jgi:hypothetical protein
MSCIPCAVAIDRAHSRCSSASCARPPSQVTGRYNLVTVTRQDRNGYEAGLDATVAGQDVARRLRGARRAPRNDTGRGAGRGALQAGATQVAGDVSD